MSDTDLFTCKDLVQLVTAYLEGTLPTPQRARFEAHLAVCPGCTAYLDQMRTTIRLIGTLNEQDIDPGAEEHLLQVFRDWHAGA
jgi:anti-sigma factor RsiW